MNFSAVPAAQGLYDPGFEHDSCGVAFVVDARGRRSHRIVAQGLTALANLEHRGAAGAEPSSGDGAGILIQVPDGFLREVVGFALPEPVRGEPAYAVGSAFLPADDAGAAAAVELIEGIAAEEGLTVLGWREVPTNDEGLGPTARSVMPRFRQVFLGGDSGMALERKVFCVRRRAQHVTEAAGCGTYFPSLSARTLVYKGMLTTGQLPTFYPDLRDKRLMSAIALVHSRFSTNTFPSWPLAHPYRYIAHNGEINTVRGNRNWMRAREALLESDLIPGDLTRLYPICADDASDSASFDEVLELLHLGGRSMPHAVLMMIPEAWENHTEMDPARRAFYQFHSCLMEPWDGPACVAFTDGTVIGAVLDRNGLRPSRWWRTEDDLVVLASEVGVLDIPPSQVVAKGRLQPGRMFLVDTSLGRIVEDDEIKAELAAEQPYAEWLHAGLVHLPELPDREHILYTHESVVRRQQLFGYTEEELRILVAPMARTGAEPVGSMGTDSPVAVLSRRPRMLYDYFSQLFAQVTNPPLDAIREELVTSLGQAIGAEHNLLRPTAASARRLTLPFPVIDNDELAKIIHINDDGDLPGFASTVLSGLYEVDGGGDALRAALDDVRRKASEAIAGGARILVLSDRGGDARHAPIPSLLMVAAVHHHLVREKTRTHVGLVVESGDCREVHHVALLIGYGASAVNPYLAFESIEDMIRAGLLGGVDPRRAIRNYVKAAGKGVLKVMSKMGISTVASYTGAQVFEALGLSEELVAEFFTGTTSRLAGIGLAELAAEVTARHRRAYPPNPTELAHRRLEVGGEYQWRREGPVHLFNPETVFLLQHSTRSGQYEVFKKYTSTVDGLARDTATLRGLFELRTGVRPAVPLHEVEPVEAIVKRFSTGAMSYGSISAEAHQTLAIAMNRLGGKSNTGEGGEDADRLYDPERRSAIKQVASGRFGVTSEYLVHSDDIQIKMAQGAKPGEGGQLPGQKVYPWVARTRHSTAGVGLISPPPHHDIYSIEDLAQLIHDLKNANHNARIHVKLVAEVGVGTVAAGVSKAHADVVLISGHDGGTGASPLSSIQAAGVPWEIGLAETQQTLVLNRLRGRISVQVDGGVRTGRDVVVGALLGADEFGFATAPLIAAGCIYMRKCHLNTCPVGVATQDPVLRARFQGKPEHVINYFFFVAEEVREYMAALGFRTFAEMIGQTEVLDKSQAIDHWKAKGLDFTRLFHKPMMPPEVAIYNSERQNHGLDKVLDVKLIELCRSALEDKKPVKLDLRIRNTNRTTGAMLSGEVAKRYGHIGLPEDTIWVRLKGSAGQSFGAWLAHGITLDLVGEGNDYVGKGLSGGRIIVRPTKESAIVPEKSIIVGNTVLYGAISGECYFRGIAGERFAVRNSGAIAVVEGTGDHGCEYMTGGVVVVIGPTGRNFAAGMSGGIAYVLDEDGDFERRCNLAMVDLEPVPSENHVMELSRHQTGDLESHGLVDVTDMTRFDEERLYQLIENHLHYTGSARARVILDDWASYLPKFVKVMPVEYRRALEEMARRQMADKTGLGDIELGLSGNGK